MDEVKDSYYSVYGHTRLTKAYCTECERYAFVQDGRLQCCDASIDVHPTFQKKECDTHHRRKLPPARHRKEQLEEQNYCCFYCDRPFNSTVFRHNRIVRLIINWDHLLPFDLTQDNRSSNFVAACQVCNALKAASVYQTVEEAKIDLLQKWQNKGYYDRF